MFYKEPKPIRSRTINSQKQMMSIPQMSEASDSLLSLCAFRVCIHGFFAQQAAETKVIYSKAKFSFWRFARPGFALMGFALSKQLKKRVVYSIEKFSFGASRVQGLRL